MGFMMLMKKISLLFLLISASLLSTSFAGRKLGNNMNKEDASSTYEEAWDEANYRIHERLLRVNTKDYGRYDPAPTFVKPPFKLIPN